MAIKHNAIRIDPKDNVAVAVEDLKKGQKIVVSGEGYNSTLKLEHDVTFAHKVALFDLETGEKIIKYGEVIGLATEHIKTGEHVHEHNIIGIRGKRKAKREEEPPQ